MKRYLVTINFTVSPISYVETNIAEIFAILHTYGSRATVEPLEQGE